MFASWHDALYSATLFCTTTGSLMRLCAESCKGPVSNIQKSVSPRRPRNLTGNAVHLACGTSGHPVSAFRPPHSHTAGHEQSPKATTRLRVVQSKQLFRMRRLQFCWLVMFCEMPLQRTLQSASCRIPLIAATSANIAFCSIFCSRRKAEFATWQTTHHSAESGSAVPARTGGLQRASPALPVVLFDFRLIRLARSVAAGTVGPVQSAAATEGRQVTPAPQAHLEASGRTVPAAHGRPQRK